MKELTEAYAGLQSSLASAKESLAEKELSLTEKQKGALEDYLQQIKPGCDFITNNIASRKASRTAETQALQRATQLIKGTPAFSAALAVEHNETMGDCLSVCSGSEEDVACKACLA